LTLAGFNLELSELGIELETFHGAKRGYGGHNQKRKKPIRFLKLYMWLSEGLGA
jgi:hypothetical protein